MTTEVAAVTTVDSATTEQQPSTPAFDPSDQHTWSPEQRGEWNKNGNIPKASPSSSDSATDKKDEKKTAVADSAPQSKDKPAVSASDSATDKESQKPHTKPEDYGEKRFQELANENKTLKQRLDALERSKPSDDKRDGKQVSQPVKEEYQPLDEKKFFTDNPKATFEDFVRAAARHEAKWESKQEIEKAIGAERQRLTQEAAAKEFKAKLDLAEQRYGKEGAAKIVPAVDKIVADSEIPLVIKAMLDRSDVLVDLAYTLSSDEAEFGTFLKLCKSDPAAALEKLVTVQSLVREQLKGKAKDAATDKAATKAEPEASAEPKPRAPKPPSEVGGRGTASEDALATAAKGNDFRSFEAEQTRRMKARSA